jgi:hypothetical protein
MGGISIATVKKCGANKNSKEKRYGIHHGEEQDGMQRPHRAEGFGFHNYQILKCAIIGWFFWQLVIPLISRY